MKETNCKRASGRPVREHFRVKPIAQARRRPNKRHQGWMQETAESPKINETCRRWRSALHRGESSEG